MNNHKSSDQNLYDKVIELIKVMKDEDYEVHGYGNCCTNTLDYFERRLKESQETI